MSKNRTSGGKSAFTLVEMLVVVAIISVVATASVGTIKGAQRQARSAKCQANLHALYNAVAAYHAQHGVYPPAGAYEYYNERSDKYGQYRGWINWVRSGSERARQGDAGNQYRNSSNRDGEVNNSKASTYGYVGTGAKDSDSRVFRSIDEGALFIYADKNMSTYCCDEFKARYGKKCMRSYAMNQRFGSRRYRRMPRCGDVPSDHPNRMALFVELGKADSKNKDPLSDLSKLVGTQAGVAGDEKAPTDVFGDDSVWDWDNKDGAGTSTAASGENIGVMHRKSGKTYGHVIFADGHLESLTVPKDTASQAKQRRSLGLGLEIEK